MPKDLDDFELMEYIASRDDEAMRTLYERHGPLLLGLGYHVLHDRQLAEDVLNEVFLEMWRSPEKYDPSRSSPRTFMILVMRRRSIDKLRSRKSDVKATAFDGRWHQTEASDDTGSLGDAAEYEDRQHLRDILDDLPDEQRVAIEMSFFGGKSNVEIAKETGDPLGTVKERIRLGLIRLRDQLRTTSGKGADDE